MKKNRKQNEFLEQLRKIPIIQVCCERVGVSRNTIYRWRKTDDKFHAAMAEALAEGEELVNDMSESQLLTLIKEKNWSALSFWLRHHHPKYTDKLKISSHINQDESLSPEQEKLLKEALTLVSSPEDKASSNNNDQVRQETNQPNNQGQENKDKAGTKKS